MSEKNGAGTMGAHQRFFFSEMWIAAGDPGLFARIAGAGFTGQSIDTASSGTKDAGF